MLTLQFLELLHECFVFQIVGLLLASLFALKERDLSQKVLLLPLQRVSPLLTQAGELAAQGFFSGRPLFAFVN